MTHRNKRAMEKLLQDPSAENVQFTDMDRLLKVSTHVAGHCAHPEYAELAAGACGSDRLSDPAAWCESAPLFKENLRNKLTRSMPNWETIAEHRYDNEDELQARDGWVSIEGPTSFSDALSFDRMMFVNLADFPVAKQRALFNTLGIRATDFQHYQPTMEIINELRDAIEDGADKWPPLPRVQVDADAGYGTRIASQQIIDKWHSEADLIDAWYGRGSWKIHKNGLDVIQRRTLPGYVMFKLPDDPFCQIRSFTLTETYAGGGKFQPAKGVRFGYVRFQGCDRR